MDNILQKANKNILTAPVYKPGLSITQIKKICGHDNIIKLDSNENPLGAGKLVKDYLNNCASETHRYPEDAASKLKLSLANINNISSKQVSLSAGSSEIIQQLFMLFTKAEDEVITTKHSFGLYRIICHKMAVKCVFAEDEISADKIDANICQNILQSINKKTKMIIIANPNNPTGSWLSENQLTKLLQQIPPYIAVVIDEAYLEYMQDKNDYCSAAKFIEQYDNLIVTRTFSKAYGLAGLRIGYCISSEAIASALNTLRNPFNVSSIAINTAYYATQDTAHLAKTLDTNNKSLFILEDFFKSKHINFLNSSANFLTANFPAKATEIYQQLLQQGIAVRPLSAYGLGDYLRISSGTQHDSEVLCNELEKII
jgi:histidinol-phosphate aminotransferase